MIDVSALMPNAAGEDFLLQPLFVRERIGEPLRWTETDPAESTVARLDATLKRYESSTADLLRGIPANVVPRGDPADSDLAPRPPMNPNRRRNQVPPPPTPAVSLSVEPGDR